MPNLNFETFPPEVIAEIMSCTNSYNDFFALTAASPIFSKIFDAYPISIMTRVAKNVLGNDNAWEEATTILIYQRNCHAIHAGGITPQKNMTSNFTLQKDDIPRLVANQQHFNSCADDFWRYVQANYPQDRPPNNLQSHNTLEGLKTLPNSLDTGVQIPPMREGIFLTPSFLAGDVLPMKLFYQTWLLALQVGHDSINTFSRLEPISEQLAADLHLVSHIMHFNKNFKKSICYSGRMRGIAPRCKVSKDFFELWGHVQQQSKRAHQHNIMLGVKIILHFFVAIFSPRPKTGAMSWKDECIVKLNVFMNSYEKLSINELVEKYELAKGWE